MAASPPIQQPMIGANGLITPVWTEFFLRLVSQQQGSGYMLKSVYDPTGSGSVVDSDKLDGELPSYYLDLGNHTGSLRLSNVDWNVRSVVYDVTAVAGDFCDVDASSGAVSVTLPDPAANVGKMVAVAKADSSANAVTLVGKVNGATNPTISSQYGIVSVVSVDTEWRQV